MAKIFQIYYTLIRNSITPCENSSLIVTSVVFVSYSSTHQNKFKPKINVFLQLCSILFYQSESCK